MAVPLPFPGLTAALGTYGKVFKQRPAAATDGGTAATSTTVTAVIPALNEVETIPYALASLAMQTTRPDRVVVVDDGSTDGTLDAVDELADRVDLEVDVRRHETPQGKTVGIKEVARSATTDKLFVLDADTFIESDDYLEQLLAAHADGDVASAFGVVQPITFRTKAAFFERHIDDTLSADSDTRTTLQARLDRERERGPLGYVTGTRPIEQFRSINYSVEQGFFADAFMRLFGTTLFPVGCAVLYDREKLVEVFDAYEDDLGDDLTNSEDIFVGFAFCDRGYENVQVRDTVMRSHIPGLYGAMRQNYLWGSGYLQSAYYFRNVATRYRKRVVTDGGTERVRPPLGRGVTAQLVDGLYPITALVILCLTLLGVVGTEIIGFLLAWEFGLYLTIGLLTIPDRLKFVRDLLPFLVVRFLTLPVGAYTYLRVGYDLVTGNRSWRK